MRLSTHLTFGGDCADAFRFYADRLDGKELRLFTYGESAAASSVPAEWGGKIVHASLTVGGDLLSGADVPAAQYEQPRGFCVLVSVGDAATAERMFGALAEGGRIALPLAKTFWSPAFGMLIDRFGVPWEVSCEGGGG